MRPEVLHALHDLRGPEWARSRGASTSFRSLRRPGRWPRGVEATEPPPPDATPGLGGYEVAVVETCSRRMSWRRTLDSWSSDTPSGTTFAAMPAWISLQPQRVDHLGRMGERGRARTEQAPDRPVVRCPAAAERRMVQAHAGPDHVGVDARRAGSGVQQHRAASGDVVADPRRHGFRRAPAVGEVVQELAEEPPQHEVDLVTGDPAEPVQALLGPVALDGMPAAPRIR